MHITHRATNTHTLLLINDHNWTETNSSPITLFSSPKPQQRSWRKRQLWPDISSGRSPSACDLVFQSQHNVKTTSLHLQPTLSPTKYSISSLLHLPPCLFDLSLPPILCSTHFFHPCLGNMPTTQLSHEWAYKHVQYFGWGGNRRIRGNEMRGRKAKIDEEREGNKGEITRVWLASWQRSPPVPVGTILLPPGGVQHNPPNNDPLNTPLSHTRVTPCSPAPFIHSLCDDSNYTLHSFCNYIDPDVYTLHKKTTRPRSGLSPRRCSVPRVMTTGFHTLPLYTLQVYACSAADYFIKT